MKIIISLKSRIITGVAILCLVFVLFPLFLARQFSEKNKISREISTNYYPSVLNLLNLSNLYEESKNLINFWAISGISNDSVFREENEILFKTKMSVVLDQLTTLSVEWHPEDRELLLTTSSLIKDSLYYCYTDLISRINLDKVTNPGLFGVDYYMEEGNVIFLSSEIEQNLSYLLGKSQLEINEAFSTIDKGESGIRNTVAGFSIALILSFILFVLFTFSYTARTLKKFNSIINMLSQGIIPNPVKIKNKDEFGKVLMLMNKLFAYLKNLTYVSKRILQKEFNTEFNPLSDKDELGIALRDLQHSLRIADEEEQRYKTEDYQRSWTSEGIAKINEILRSSSDNLEDLANDLLKEIVNYTSSKVGALFIITTNESDEESIDLVAAYAYDRKKILNRKIRIGEGLIGRCVQENETIYLTDVPKGYITIKSGMGESDPASILIAPIRLNDKVFGVIEIATFSQYEPNKIKFIETIGESIAVTISKVQINQQTTRLLAQTRMQAEEMAAQDEELRQNMEELRATQDQSAIREERLIKEIEHLKAQQKIKNN